MNVLVLNASPRRHGTISQAVERFADGACCSHLGDFSDDTQIEIVNVSDLKFAPCRGCMQCRKCGACCLPEDDAHRVAEKIFDCDVLVVAAPVYWGNMPGTLKALFDRMVYALMGESRLGVPKPLHKGKDAYIITSCTTPFPFNFFCRQTSGMVAALKEILGTAGFKIKGKVVIPGTKAQNGLSAHAGKCAYRMGFSTAA